MESAGFERDRRLKMTVKTNRSSSYSQNDEGDITMTPPILTYSRRRLFARLRPARCPLPGPPLRSTPLHCPFAFICLCLLQTPHPRRLPLPLSPPLILFRRGAHSITLSARISVCPSFPCASSQRRRRREGEKKKSRGRRRDGQIR